MKGNRIILAAHRGDRKNAPENTMPAFEKALNLGADMIETDVRMTKDGELILMHDRNTVRTTGHDGFTNEMSLEEIKTLDAGKLFSKAYTNTRVPTVQEFIELIKDTDMLVNWELKDYPTELGDAFAFATADILIAMIEASGLTERSVVNSFSDRVLEHIYKTHGHTFPIHGQGIWHCQRTKDQASVPQEDLYDWCCLYPDEKGKRPLDFPENFAYCVKRGILPCVCVPDEKDTYAEYIRLGCRMFTSNDIYQADEILRTLGVR